MIASALAATAAQWRRAGRAAVVVQVLASRGSVPREVGTRMLVAADAVAGTIGGGHLELNAIAQARQALRDALGEPPAPSQQHIPLGPALGQCCGGAVTLQFTPLADDDPATWAAGPPRFTLQLYGAGHVGQAIVQVLAGIDCRVQWIDERAEQFEQAATNASTPTWPPHITPVCVEPVEAEVDAAAPGTHILVMTHSHALDLAIVTAALSRPDLGFIGLIGSHSKRARFERQMRERGMTAEQLSRLHCPVGLPGLRGKEPGVIAVSAVAQLLLIGTGV